VPVSIVSIFCNHENLNFDYLFFSITMELFNKALFLSQQKIFALTHRRVFTLMVNLIQIINLFVLLFRKNVIEKSSIIWRVLPLVKINTRISETPCIPIDPDHLDPSTLQRDQKE
jgi:hypothetical protein